jgi:hypothetical protein
MSETVEKDSHPPRGLDGIGEDEEIPSTILEDKTTPDSLTDSIASVDNDFNLLVDSCDEESHDAEKDATIKQKNEKNDLTDEEKNLLKESTRWKEKTNFTADSPYYAAFCDSEVSNLNVLAETFGDIATRTKAFCRTGVLMSEAMNRLALSCKLRNVEDVESDDELGKSDRIAQESMKKRMAIGDEMAEILELLGEVRFYHIYYNFLIGLNT